MQSQLVMNRTAHSGDRAVTFTAIVYEAAQQLQSSPRDLKLYRALERTYLHPAVTQEQAAELLDLPFSTYRRHLKAGVLRLTELLWQEELDAGEM